MTFDRLVRGALGASLLVAGLTAASALSVATAWATPEDSPPAAVSMRQMMDAVHGPGTAGRLGEIDGVGEMMATCDAMMAAMPMMGGEMGPGQMGPGMHGMMDSDMDGMMGSSRR